MLYNTVPHPPAAYLGPAHSFRAADGGGNCLQDKDLGRAGTGYARSVQSQFCTPQTGLPDPGLIFDTLLKRRDVSSPYVLFSYTHSHINVVRTSQRWHFQLHFCLCNPRHPLHIHDGPQRLLQEQHKLIPRPQPSLRSQCVSPPYHVKYPPHTSHITDQCAQDLVRDKKSGRGLLWPDTFSEDRLIFLPPAASAILVILSRNHNVSAKKKIEI